MDELKFHFVQRIELLQIWLLELSEKSRDVLTSLEESLVQRFPPEYFAGLKSDLVRAIEKAVVVTKDFLATLEPSYYIGKMTAALGRDFNRATLFAGCIGFTIGSGVGIALGVCLQSPQTPITLMKSIVGNCKGVDSISLFEDAVVPKIRYPNEVFIEVKCATIDSLDLKVSNGYSKTLRETLSKYSGNSWTTSSYDPSEVVLGRSGSGTVIEIGSKVEKLEPGDQVYFLSPPWCQGTLSEYVVLPHDFVTRKPLRLGFEAAAALPFCGFLAWHYAVNIAGITVRNAHLKRVLVHSGGSGCGWVLVQLCSNLGCRVATTGLNRTAGILRTLGAQDVLTLEAGDLDEQYRMERYDIVFNTVGPIATSFCRGALAPGGKYIEAFPAVMRSDSFGFLLRSVFSFCFWFHNNLNGAHLIDEFSSTSKGLEEVTKLVEKGRVQAVIEKVFTPEEVDKALKLVESPNCVGKTIVRFSGPASNYSSKPDLSGL